MKITQILTNGIVVKNEDESVFVDFSHIKGRIGTIHGLAVIAEKRYTESKSEASALKAQLRDLLTHLEELKAVEKTQR